MSDRATPTTTFPEPLDLVALNTGQRLGMWSNGATTPLTLHDADGDEVDDPADAVFVTTPTPDGQWASALLSTFAGTVH